MTPSSTTGSSLQRTDTGLQYWFRNLADAIAADPQALGLTAADAARLTALADEYESALQLATAPGTRTAGTIAAKNASRAQALEAFRRIASQIRADFRIEDSIKIGLGIRPAPAGPKPRVPAPKTHPLLHIAQVRPGLHTLRYCDSATPDSRRKPRGVQHLELFVAVGTEPASDPEQATYFGSFTRTPFQVPTRAEDAGLLATYFGRWSTRTALLGPWSLPVSMTIIGSDQGKPIKPAEAVRERAVIEVKQAASKGPADPELPGSAEVSTS